MNRLIDFAFALQESHLTEWLLPLVLKVTLIALIGRLIIAALPRASASTRYLVAVTTFCSMLAVPIVARSGIEWRLALLPPVPQHVAATTTLASEGSAVAPVAEFAEILPRPVAQTITIIDGVRSAWRGWLLLLVAAIGCGFLVRMLVGAAGIAWVTRRASEIEDDTIARDFDEACDVLGVGRFVRLLSSDRVSVPLTWGIRRPALLLPHEALQWSRERLRVIFLHELAHLRRGDAITLLITRGATALYWFHPLAWSLERAARRECEQACDDLVLAAGTRASEYADHLLDIARSLPRHDPFAAVTLAMSRRSQLEGRLLSILQPHVSRGAASRRLKIAAIVVASVVVIPIAALRLVAQPAPPPEPQDPPRKAGAEISVVPNAKTDDVSGSRWFDRGTNAYRHGRVEEAVAAYQKAIAAGYRGEVAAYNIACTYAVHDENDKALEWLKRAIDAGFDDKDLMERDDDLDSLRSLPRYREIVANAFAEATHKRAKAAVNDFEQLRSSRSNRADDWYAAGNRLLKAGEHFRAIDAYNQAVRIEPYMSAAIYNTACAYALQGDTSHALDTLELAIVRGYGDGDAIRDDSDLDSIHGARFDALANLADDLSLHAIGDDWADALPRYERIVKAHPDLGRAWFNLGYVRLEADDAPGALAAFNQTLKMGHRPGTTMYNLACAEARLGHRDAAFEWLSKAEAAGFKVAASACGDKDLASLRSDARFNAFKEYCWEKHFNLDFGKDSQ